MVLCVHRGEPWLVEPVAKPPATCTIVPPELRFLSDNYIQWLFSNLIQPILLLLAQKQYSPQPYPCMRKGLHKTCASKELLAAAKHLPFQPIQKTFLLMNVPCVWQNGAGTDESGGAMESSGQGLGNPSAQLWQLHHPTLLFPRAVPQGSPCFCQVLSLQPTLFNQKAGPLNVEVCTGVVPAQSSISCWQPIITWLHTVKCSFSQHK